MPGITNIKAHNSLIFDNLEKSVHEAVISITKKRAENMRDTLRYRRSMYSGGARWPKWVDDREGNIKKIPSNRSFAGWELSDKKNGRFYLYNHTVNPVDEYPYPNILAYGMPPGGKWKLNSKKKDRKIVKGTDGRFYSTQMPRGIKPWLDRQLKLMKIDTENAIAGLNKPYAQYAQYKGQF